MELQNAWHAFFCYRSVPVFLPAHVGVMLTICWHVLIIVG